MARIQEHTISVIWDEGKRVNLASCTCGWEYKSEFAHAAIFEAQVHERLTGGSYPTWRNLWGRVPAEPGAVCSVCFAPLSTSDLNEREQRCEQHPEGTN